MVLDRFLVVFRLRLLCFHLDTIFSPTHQSRPSIWTNDPVPVHVGVFLDLVPKRVVTVEVVIVVFLVRVCAIVLV